MPQLQHNHLRVSCKNGPPLALSKDLEPATHATQQYNRSSKHFGALELALLQLQQGEVTTCAAGVLTACFS
jgi:hypothetical protein